MAAEVREVLFSQGIILLSTHPGQLLGIIGGVMTSPNAVQALANQTNLSTGNVTDVLLSFYNCIMNKTLSNQTLEAWNCFYHTEESARDASNNTKAGCGIDNLTAFTNFVFFILGLVLLVLMSLARKRRKCLRGCCFGRPGCVIPLNMLDSYENRFGNAIAFGATSTMCCLILLGDYNALLGPTAGEYLEDSKTPSYLGALAKIAVNVCVATAYYPLFACMAFDNKILSSVVGFFYTLLWTVAAALRLEAAYVCVEKSVSYMTFIAISEAPGLLCLLLLLVKFAVMFCRAVLQWKELRRVGADVSQMTYTQMFSNWREQYMYLHVMNLLRGSKSISPTTHKDKKLPALLRKKLYQFKPDFKYSTRVICSFSVASYMTFVLIVTICGLWFALGTRTLKVFIYSEDLVLYLQENDKLIREVRDAFDVLHVSLYAATGCTAVIFCALIVNMVTWYRGHMMRLRKGDKNWLPTSFVEGCISPTTLTAASMKYAGFQIAYCVWGVAILTLLLWIIFFVVGWLIILPFSNGNWSFLLNILSAVWPALIATLLIDLGQILSARFIFLHDGGASFAINNRNAYHVMSFFMFFFNIALGIASCLLRIFRSMVFGVLFLARLQKSILPRSFEEKDPGYMAYVGYLMLEHTHSNPVLCVFYALLLEHEQTMRKKRMDQAEKKTSICLETFQMDNVAQDSSQVIQKKRWLITRNRWHLALTLLRNPLLKKYRHHQKPLKNVELLLEGLHNNALTVDA